MARMIEHIFKNGVEMKICTKCHNLLPLSDFRIDRKNQMAIIAVAKFALPRKTIMHTLKILKRNTKKCLNIK